MSSTAATDSRLLRSSSASDASVKPMATPAICRRFGDPSTAWHAYMRMCVRSWCVATTDTEHGSAGLMPTFVVKTRASSAPVRMSRTCLPICVSHSDVTTKMSVVDAWSRFATASGPNVPPLWLTMITIASRRSQPPSAKAWPVWGAGKSWPSNPRILLLLMALTLSRVRHSERSAANCSASQRLTSQPVTKTSTPCDGRSPDARFSRRARSFLPRVQAARRLSWPSFHSLRMSSRTRGTSARSAATGSFATLGSGRMSGLRSRGTRRRLSVWWRSDSWTSV